MIFNTLKEYLMKRAYRNIEKGFEKLTTLATAIMGNSITFILATIIVFYWLSNKDFWAMDVHQKIGDAILGLTFLSLFIIQKSFNRFSGSIHLKVNELVASHESASNKVINIEEKTEQEIVELSKEYADLAVAALEEEIIAIKEQQETPI